MNFKEIKQSRILLGLNQTDFASLLGWTSKRNVVNLERNNKRVMTQTALAVECLLRRNNKFEVFEMLNKMQPVLDFILLEIKKANKKNIGNTISEDDTNEVLVNIFQDASNKFTDIDFELVDDENTLTELFDYSGYCSIREAENGDY